MTAMNTASTSAIFALNSLNLRRTLKDIPNLMFTIAMPVGFYLLFGAAQDYSSLPDFEHGNIPAYIMVSMALYGAIIAATASAGSFRVEQTTGWGRQLALTPLQPAEYLGAQMLDLLLRSTLPVIAVFLTGALTGAEMSATAWVTTFVLSVVTAVPFGLYGAIIAGLFHSEAAVAIASTSIVVFAFASNMLMPLPHDLYEFARYTPLYGANALAHYPLSEGAQSIADAPYLVTDLLGFALLNFGAWSAIFVVIYLIMSTRDKGR